jgi:hypothetical protein
MIFVTRTSPLDGLSFASYAAALDAEAAAADELAKLRSTTACHTP